MNIEILRKSNWIIYEVISGSHAYGTNVEGSDVDVRGVYIQPLQTMLGINDYVPQVSDETNDTTFYELGNFIELAAKGNPNIMELLNMPESQVVYKHPIFDQIFTEDIKKKFLTTKLRHSFSGYAYAQIKKAKGLNKKISWETDRITRKSVLDFCYVLDSKEQSINFKEWSATTNYKYTDVGLASVNNFPDVYSMYYLGPDKGGIFNEDSNDVQLREIPKRSKFLHYVRFDRNAYSTHCKDFREYEDWIKNRNPERYQNNVDHGKNYDSKNLMHTFRLLYTAKDIAEGKGIVVRRPEREELLAIRRGERDYGDLVAEAETIAGQIDQLFNNSGLPRKVDLDINRFLTDIRLAVFKNPLIFAV